MDAVPFEPHKVVVAPKMPWGGPMGAAPEYIRHKGRNVPLIEDPRHPRDRVSILDEAILEPQDIAKPVTP